MALTQPDCPPAVAEAALRLLRYAGTASRDVLRSSLAVDLDSNAVSMVLRDLEAIEVLVGDNGSVRLSDRATQAPSNAAAIRSCLFAAVDVKQLWEADGDGTLPLEAGRDLVRALAWFSSL